MLEDIHRRRRLQDRDGVPVDHDCDVHHLAEKHGISEQEARRLIDRYGDRVEKLDEEAAKLKDRFG